MKYPAGPGGPAGSRKDGNGELNRCRYVAGILNFPPSGGFFD